MSNKPLMLILFVAGLALSATSFNAAAQSTPGYWVTPSGIVWKDPFGGRLVLEFGGRSPGRADHSPIASTTQGCFEISPGYLPLPTPTRGRSVYSRPAAAL